MIWRDLRPQPNVGFPPIADIELSRHAGVMTATLRFRYDFSDDPDDDFGWLMIEIVSGGFAGKGGFWVQRQDVKDFGESLSAFPIADDASLGAQWGFDKREGEDLRLKVQITPANNRGDLNVSAEVADYLTPSQRVRTSFLTNYPDLEAFKASISKLMSRDADEATLLGT